MVTLKSGRIDTHWAALLDHCHDQAEAIFQKVEANLKTYDVPGLTWRRESVAPGWLKGLFGKRRDYLLATHERFPNHLVAINARDYGTALDVVWYLVVGPRGLRFWLQLWLLTIITIGFYLLRVRYEPQALDVFDQQDLDAYAAVSHRSVLYAVEELMRERDLDLTRLERRSRGRLQIA